MPKRILTNTTLRIFLYIVVWLSHGEGECSIPEITDVPPKEIKEELALLCATLDEDVPAKIPDRNLLIATWNLRAFGGLTESWKCQENDSPKRDLHALRCIAEIVSRFDVIAL